MGDVRDSLCCYEEDGYRVICVITNCRRGLMGSVEIPIFALCVDSV